MYYYKIKMPIYKSWLSYPRTFRLQYEAKQEHPYINIGPIIQVDTSIETVDLVYWQGTMYLTKYDIILSFTMTCDKDFPNNEPKIKFDQNDNIKKLKDVCDKELNLLSSKFNWTIIKSIIENLLPVYNILNS
jgi:ubiquitin-protein ligase